jgi:hypothetical protein
LTHILICSLCMEQADSVENAKYNEYIIWEGWSSFAKLPIRTCRKMPLITHSSCYIIMGVMGFVHQKVLDQSSRNGLGMCRYLR